MRIKILLLSLTIFIALSCSLLPMGPDGEDGLDGTNGTDGDDGISGTAGIDGTVIPGGIISVYDDNGTITADTSVKIIFDDDVSVNEGDAGEYEFSINIGAYRNGSNNINHSQVWSAPGVPPGNYYVYAWLDLDNDGTFETDTTYHYIFDTSNDYYYNTGNIDSSNDPASIAPNYTLWVDFAAQFNISFTHST